MYRYGTHLTVDPGRINRLALLLLMGLMTGCAHPVAYEATPGLVRLTSATMEDGDAAVSLTSLQPVVGSLILINADQFRRAGLYLAPGRYRAEMVCHRTHTGTDGQAYRRITMDYIPTLSFRVSEGQAYILDCQPDQLEDHLNIAES